MASKAAQKRLTKEFVAMQKDPPPFIWAVPEEKNILTWNYIIRGPPDSPFTGGEFHGLLLFPPEYPFKPPGIKMLTPSGRFHPDKKICFSMSDFHPGSWNPAWSVATILTGLLSFMLSDEMTTGSVNSSPAQKRQFATKSHAWNLDQARFKEAFPDYCTPHAKDVPNMGEQHKQPNPTLPTSSSIPYVALTVPAPNTLLPLQSSASDALKGTSKTTDDASGAAEAALSWGQVLWEKWRWGVLIALAVVVSRLSSARS
ncbi:UBC-like protein [Lentinula aciculospora]|uniref:Ubiquitin-conjugating enzyme E2 6 n=1 Tax=Lentinula aciculospora TaxID=153920 RepID=A0A9W9A040_9AGAR|nr:UBC-like protein [Lentinula aciculospora]